MMLKTPGEPNASGVHLFNTFYGIRIGQHIFKRYSPWTNNIELILTNAPGRSLSVTCDKFKRLHPGQKRQTPSTMRKMRIKLMKMGCVHRRYPSVIRRPVKTENIQVKSVWNKQAKSAFVFLSVYENNIFLPFFQAVSLLLAHRVENPK